MTKMTTIPENYNNIRAGIVELLEQPARAAARNVNTLMTATYWEIGRRIVQSEQAGEKRAEYGDYSSSDSPKTSSASFGRGFGPRNLAQMRSFYLAWPHEKILQTLSAKSSTPIPFNEIQGKPQPVRDLANQFPLPWSAYVRLLSVKSQEARTFTRPKRCVRAGLSGNWTARSAVNSMSASRSPRTKPPCWRKRRTPNPAIW